MKYCRKMSCLGFRPSRKTLCSLNIQKVSLFINFLFMSPPLMRRGNLLDAHYRKRGNRSFMNGSKMLTCGRDIAGMYMGHIGYVFTYPAFKVL